MILRINKSDLQNIILWGSVYKDDAQEVGVPFEKDEDELLSFLKEQRDKSNGIEVGGKLSELTKLVQEIEHNHNWYIQRGGLLPYDWDTYMGKQLRELVKITKELNESKVK